MLASLVDYGYQRKHTVIRRDGNEYDVLDSRGWRMREGFLDFDGVYLRVREQGAGLPVLLTPGGPGCCDYLGPLASLLDDRAHVIRWEPRGCGESDIGGPYDVETTLADMDEIRKEFGFERWIVGGHSHGAFLSLAYALTYPQHTMAVIDLAGRGVLRDRQWHITYHDNKDLKGELEPEYAYPHNMDVNREGVISADVWCRDPMLLKQLSQLDVPVLIVQGGRDIRPVWPAEQLANLLPHASLVTLPEAEHVLWLTHADTLRAMLGAFLNGLEDQASS